MSGFPMDFRPLPFIESDLQWKPREKVVFWKNEETNKQNICSPILANEWESSAMEVVNAGRRTFLIYSRARITILQMDVLSRSECEFTTFILWPISSVEHLTTSSFSLRCIKLQLPQNFLDEGVFSVRVRHPKQAALLLVFVLTIYLWSVWHFRNILCGRRSTLRLNNKLKSGVSAHVVHNSNIVKP